MRAAPWGGMRTHSRLRVLDDALAALRALRPLLPKIKRHSRKLAVQLEDAGTSMVLNIGEAQYSDPGNQRARLYTAAGSAGEVRVGLEAAIALGYLTVGEAEEADSRLDSVLAQLYCIQHRRR